MKQFLLKHWKKILLLVCLFILLLGAYRLLQSSRSHSLIFGHPDNIIVISPDESQDVIVIGDPETVKVKPKNKK